MVQVLVAVSLLLLNPISLFAQTTADKGSINNELVKAINTFGLGDLQKVQALLDQGADPNARDTDGNTVLQRAVNAVSAKTVALLLAKGADPNSKDKQGRTPLMYVGFYSNPAQADKLEVAKRLVEKGADVNAVDMYDVNVISFLVPYNLPTVIDYLISQGAQVDRIRNNGSTALSVAAENGKTDIVRILLSHGADPNLKAGTGWSPLDVAIHYQHQDIVDAMTASAKGAVLGAALITASIEGNTAMVHDFIAKKADVNAVNEAGMSALMAAIDKGHEDIVKILLDAGASTDIVDKGGYGSFSGETALCMASRMKQSTIVAALLTKKANVDAPCGAVQGAAQAGSADIVKLLADAGADMKDRFTGHWRALFIAAEKNDAAIARILLDHGTPVDMRDNNDSTALMIAAGKGSLDMIRLLAEYKADLEAVNEKRTLSDVGSNLIGTAYMWAIESRQQTAADLLVSLGAMKKNIKDIHIERSNLNILSD